MLTLAHAGHWALQLLYVAPVVIALAALGWQSWRDRRQQRNDPTTRRRS